MPQDFVPSAKASVQLSCRISPQLFLSTDNKVIQKTTKKYYNVLISQIKQPFSLRLPSSWKKNTCSCGSSNRHIWPAKQPSACQQGGHPGPAVFQLQGEQGRSHPLHAEATGTEEGTEGKRAAQCQLLPLRCHSTQLQKVSSPPPAWPRPYTNQGGILVASVCF